MKKYTFVLFVLFIILAAAFNNSVSLNINTKKAATPNTVTSLTQIENTEGPVSIAVTPLNLKDGSSTWNFEISLNTHSGILDDDLVAVSELVDNQEKLYKPISWEGDSPVGHHRKGVLKFNSVSLRPKSVKLIIKNIGGIKERSYEWNL